METLQSAPPAYHYLASSGDTQRKSNSLRSFLHPNQGFRCFQSWPYYSKQNKRDRDEIQPHILTSWILINCCKPLQISETISKNSWTPRSMSLLILVCRGCSACYLLCAQEKRNGIVSVKKKGQRNHCFWLKTTIRLQLEHHSKQEGKVAVTFN